MSAVTERAVQSAAAGNLPEASPQAQARTPAREATPPTALPVLLPGGDTASLISPQAREALGRLLGAFKIPKGTDVLRASGLHAAHTRHKEAAGQWEAAVLRVPRRAWGYLHLLLKACIGVLDWITESPIRTIAAVIVTVLSTHWL